MKTCADCGSRFAFVRCHNGKGWPILLCRTCAYESTKELNELFERSEAIVIPFVKRKMHSPVYGVQYV